MSKFKNSMLREFDMFDLGKMRFFSWNQGDIKVRWYLYMPKEICIRDFDKVWYDGK